MTGGLRTKNTPEERAEVFEKAADDAENSAGELHDESLFLAMTATTQKKQSS